MRSAATPAVNVTAMGGTPQSALIDTPFLSPLQATVTDAGNNPVAGAVVTFNAPGAAVSLEASYFSMALNDPDVSITDNQGNFTNDEGNAGKSFVTAVGAGLGPNGLPVLNATGQSILHDFDRSTGELEWWSTLDPNISVLNNNIYPPAITLPFSDYNMFSNSAALGQNGDDGNAFLTAKFSGPLSLASAGPIIFNECSNDDSLVYISGGIFGANGTLVVDNGGIHDTFCLGANVNLALLSNVPAGTYTLTVFYDDRHQTMATFSLGLILPSASMGSFGGASTVTAVTNASGIATAPPFSANGQPGSYLVTGTVAGLPTSASFNLTNKLGQPAGLLNGIGDSSISTANLTSEGNVDWIHFGDATMSRKAGVSVQLSNYSVVGSGTTYIYSNDPRPINWTDGTPTQTMSGDTSGVFIYGTGQGFSLTAPADTELRSLVLHVGGWNSGGVLTAHLSDGSAADYVDATSTVDGQYDRNYTLTYQAGVTGQMLVVTWEMSFGSGNITLNGVALQGGNESMVASAGASQSATVNTPFAVAPQVTVSSGGNPLRGATVTFTAPSSGASATFSSGATATGITDASGIATTPPLTANTQVGQYNVVAAVSGVTTSATFSLTNSAGPASSIIPSVGNLQSTTVSSAFPIQIEAAVRDSFGNPVGNVAVTFSAPGSGASATFSTGATATAITNASGVATAPTLTANNQAGNYNVTASVKGLTATAAFSLTNTLAPATGSLKGSVTSTNSLVNLTAEGGTDWVHWGGAVVNRKAGVPSVLSNYTAIGTGVLKYINDHRPMSWTDGTPTLKTGSDTVGLYISGTGKGFSVQAPADTTLRTLLVHVGGWNSGGTLTAQLSDGSAPNLVEVTPFTNGQYDRNYTLTYSAGNAGQTLNVLWVMTSGSGNVTLSAAALR